MQSIDLLWLVDKIPENQPKNVFKQGPAAPISTHGQVWHLVLRYDESRQILARVLTLISSGNRPRVPSTDAKCELSFCRFYNITSILQIATACTLRLRFLSKPFFNNLLGHAPVPQSWVSVFVPVQGRPPLAGGGLVQLRVRYCLPPPQDLEHWLKFEKTVQPPSIGTMDKPT